MKFFALAVIGLSFSPAMLPASPSAQVSHQFREEWRQDSTQPYKIREAAESAATLKADGSWPDLNYADQSRSNWQPAKHAARMRQMAAVALAEPSQKALLTDAVHRAFAFWIQNDFQCPNWWQNTIGVPQVLGATGLLLGEDLQEEEKHYLTQQLLPRSVIGMTGQNRLWLAGNTLMLALLTDDTALAKTAADTIWSEVRVTTEEGIQPDFSFHQHGAQLQFGNYGMRFAEEVGRWIGILRDSPWQIPPDRLRIFRDYLLLGGNWVCWRGIMDFNACGRQIKPGFMQSKAFIMKRVMNRGSIFDPQKSREYAAFVERNEKGAPNDLVGNRFFWRSDYMVNRTPSTFATLKMSSNRVIGAESLNGENLQGYHEADGVLMLYQSGAEYDGIFPIWDWRYLPGTTTAQTEPPPFRESFVPTDFVGGASDGTLGVAAMHYLRDGVEAHKGWFFGGDTIFCLGAGISGAANLNVATTINQANLHGEVKGSQGPVADGIHDNTPWLEHAGFRYTLLENASLTLKTTPVSGSWQSVYTHARLSTDAVTAPVFLLQIPHGTAPKDAHYAWTVTPAGNPPAGKILSNTQDLQSVAFGEENYGVIFWTEGLAVLGRLEISTDTPCVVLISGSKVHISDPTQAEKTLRFSINGKEHVVSLPTGAEAGSPAILDLPQD